MHACMCVSVCVRVCKRVRVHVPLRTYLCVCVCICHTGLRACIARVQGCVHAHVRACWGGCMHICVKEECTCAVSIPASSPLWKPLVGLACMPCSYSYSGAPGAAASEPLAVEPLAALEPCEGFPSTGHGC